MSIGSSGTRRRSHCSSRSARTARSSACCRARTRATAERARWPGRRSCSHCTGCSRARAASRRASSTSCSSKCAIATSPLATYAFRVLPQLLSFPTPVCCTVHSCVVSTLYSHILRIHNRLSHSSIIEALISTCPVRIVWAHSIM